jgi:hypothetical protein
MKKIIKLTERDLTRIVKRVIKENEMSELFRSTYSRAAEKAREKGLEGLGDRFRSHGKRHGGIEGDKNIISVTPQKDPSYKFDIMLPSDSNVSYDFEKSEDDTHIWVIKNVEILNELDDAKLIVNLYTLSSEDENKPVDRIELRLEDGSGTKGFLVKCSNRKYAKTIVNYLENALDGEGLDFSNFDEKKIIINY